MTKLRIDTSETPGSETVVFLHANGVSGRMWANRLLCRLDIRWAGSNHRNNGVTYNHLVSGSNTI